MTTLLTKTQITNLRNERKEAREQVKDLKAGYDTADRGGKMRITSELKKLDAFIARIDHDLEGAPSPTSWKQVWEKFEDYREAVAAELAEAKTKFQEAVEKYGVTYAVENSEKYVQQEQEAHFFQVQLSWAERQTKADDTLAFPDMKLVELVIAGILATKTTATEELISQARGGTWTCAYRNAVEKTKTNILASLAGGSAYCGVHFAAYSLVHTYDDWQKWEELAD